MKAMQCACVYVCGVSAAFVGVGHVCVCVGVGAPNLNISAASHNIKHGAISVKTEILKGEFRLI